MTRIITGPGESILEYRWHDKNAHIIWQLKILAVIIILILIFFFVNNEFKNYIIKNNIVDDCIDFPNGLYKQSLWFNRINGMLIFYCILRDVLKPILKNIFGQRLTALRQVLKKSLFE
jgi:hypothetical protein